MATTMLHLGRTDQGRPLTLDEFLTADYEGGYKYELIDGKLYVSPAANFPENAVQEWLNFQLKLFSRANPKVLNYVSSGARVFIPNRCNVTASEPDVAAYHDLPTELSLREIRWQDVSPFLVAEVLSADDPDKDLVRNADLYFRVPSIKEYWILDAREDAEHPRLIVRRRSGKRWRIMEVEPGSTYSTRFLPGFALTLNGATEPFMELLLKEGER
jgi:Uma2 family endonuclease